MSAYEQRPWPSFQLRTEANQSFTLDAVREQPSLALHGEVLLDTSGLAGRGRCKSANDRLDQCFTSDDSSSCFG